MEILKAAHTPIVAAELAVKIGLGGERETKRRKIRAIVARLRDNGHWIIAFNQEGYWLTTIEKDWLDYQAGRSIDAKRIIKEAADRRRMIVDNKGQGLLFVKGL